MGNCCSKAPWRKICRPCCCHSKDDEPSRHYHAKRNVHLITKIEKWEEKLSEANRDSKMLIANFSASWCTPCKTLELTYQELAAKYTSIIFVLVDVEELAELSNSWNVEATPTIFFLKNGRLVDKHVGANKLELQKKTASLAGVANRTGR